MALHSIQLQSCGETKMKNRNKWECTDFEQTPSKIYYVIENGESVVYCTTTRPLEEARKQVDDAIKRLNSNVPVF